MGWQFYVSVAGLFITIIISATALAYRLGRHFERLESGLAVLRVQMDSHLTLLGALIRILHKRKSLSDDEFSDVLKSYSMMVTAKASSFIEQELHGGNPLTIEETQRLNNYLGKARQGQFFGSEEVEDYNALVLRVQQDKPNDPDVWPLIALGAFLLGLFLASQKK